MSTHNPKQHDRRPASKDDFIGFLFGNAMIGSFWAVPLLLLGLAVADFLCWIAAGMKPGAVDSLVCLAYLKQQNIFPDGVLMPIVAHMFVGTIVAMLGLFFLQPLGWITGSLSLLMDDPWWPVLIGFLFGEAYSFVLWIIYQWSLAADFYMIHVPYFFVFAIPCVVAGITAATGAVQWKQQRLKPQTFIPETKAFSEL